jgi:DNA modification methylase
MFAKGRRYYFNKKPLIDKKVEEDMWTITARPKNGGLDTAPYPDELVQRCLEIGCKPGGTVLDPFLGSGTTTRVALSMGYSAIGIELNKEFCQYSVDQLKVM